MANPAASWDSGGATRFGKGETLDDCPRYFQKTSFLEVGPPMNESQERALDENGVEVLAIWR